MLTGELKGLDLSRRYTVKETAQILGICRNTLIKYTRSNDITAIVHKPTGKLFYEGKEIQKFFYSII